MKTKRTLQDIIECPMPRFQIQSQCPKIYRKSADEVQSCVIFGTLKKVCVTRFTAASAGKCLCKNNLTRQLS